MFVSLSAMVGAGHIIAQHPALLFAIWLNPTKVFVYRSRLVRDTDDIYVPVTTVLDNFRHKLKDSMIVADPQMFFGEAEQLVYEIGDRLDGA